MSRGAADAVSNFARRIDDHRHKQEQDPREISSQDHDYDRYRNKGEELLQEFREDSRHGVLHPLDVVDDRRE